MFRNHRGDHQAVESNVTQKIKAFGLGFNPTPWAIGPLGLGRNKQTGKMIPVIGPNTSLVAYQEAVRSELIRQGAEMLPPDYSIRFRFSRQLEKYVSNATGRNVTRNRADATNLQKATEDAMQGIMLNDDENVVCIQSRFASKQSNDTDPWVLIECMYDIKGLEDEDVLLPGSLSDEGLEAMRSIKKWKATPDRVVNNEWIP